MSISSAASDTHARASQLPPTLSSDSQARLKRITNRRELWLKKFSLITRLFFAIHRGATRRLRRWQIKSMSISKNSAIRICSGWLMNQRAGAQRLPVGDDRAAVEPGARVFGGRLDDGGQREVVVDLPLRDGPARHRESGLREQGVGDRLATAGGDRPQARAGDRDAGELERPDHVLLPLALAVHALAQVEDEVGPPRHREPSQVVPHRNLADLVPAGGEDRPDLVHGLHHATDVLGGPVGGSRG